MIRTTTRDSSTDDVRAGAVSMGDITDLTRVHFPRNTLNGAGDRIDYYRFTLTEPREINFGVRQQDADADMFLEDAEGNVLHNSVKRARRTRRS